VIGVIEPGVRAVVEQTDSKRVGAIGTVGTVASGAYEHALEAMDTDVELVTCACPGFVEFVERGITSGPQVSILAERLLAPIVDAEVDALLLGCTHYPFLARVISDVVGPSVVLVSSAEETAFALSRMLVEGELARAPGRSPGSVRFISSGDVAAFTRVGSRLLGPELVDAESWSPHAP
jgi:glutamate racemase